MKLFKKSLTLNVGSGIALSLLMFTAFPTFAQTNTQSTTTSISCPANAMCGSPVVATNPANHPTALTHQQYIAILERLISLLQQELQIILASQNTSGNSSTPPPTPQPTSNISLNATPTTGTSPLAVTFSGTGLTGGSQYIVEFGDGSNSGPLSAINICMGTTTNPQGCPRIHTTHTYPSDGNYTASLEPYIGCMWSNPRCMIAVVSLATTSISVIH